MNTKDYYKVSYDRWDNAVNCFKNKDFFVSLYLAGYSVECILKYVILETLFAEEVTKPNGLNLVKTAPRSSDYYPLQTHDLAGLMHLGNQRNVFVLPKESDFKEVIKWSSEWRYATEHNINNRIAEDFLLSLVDISKQLKSSLQGKIKIKEFVI